ncbi:23S rRNA (pseudouridine(1915)-N(3))-methyltransferase RlmH [Spiribacter roseus]|uniref:23S rRNA (pseudouridine(1915)-N(3))-methyltransferase RlmH n=1 Tax=Spiribacter roseus TaxID=1855875 RepID=UPI0013303528|nr:23S rRNA (pseudouridine(1915)-N(3))-methyltransferase RlmH [Spiribacter roseus]KAF0284468.1 23S rRNA (pseudouridine(1915)-N(3))-methyltransferase RlmH [Spiribacter roseus]
MRLNMVAVGRRPPDWIRTGVDEFAQRMPRQLPLAVKAVNPGDARRSGDIDRARAQEADALLAAAGSARLIALDERGRSWRTPDLAEYLDTALHEGRDLAFVIGGADGLDQRCLNAAERRWSLSALTLPHMLVRVIVAEQLYRAWTLLAGHPYHRA